MDLGIIEGFFGPAWPHDKRLSYAEFLQQHGGDYYIYAPKQDPHLRKQWRAPWDHEYLSFLESMCRHFHQFGIRFGVALSPFGLSANLDESDKDLLIQKLTQLSDVGIDLLGVFFDDMPVTPNLASVQVAAMDFIEKHFSKQIVFCPSFYCFDPILEKVFGKQPDRYLEDIATGISPQVDLAWTGPKVISPEIPLSHLQEVRQLLKRKPFIWENLFANDGPKNCKFLKLRPFDGRSAELTSEVSSWGFNMMNQPELSKITFLGAQHVLKKKLSPEKAFTQAMQDLLSSELQTFLTTHRQLFLESGLDKISEDEKSQLLTDLQQIPDPAAKEISSWLRGEYVVGSECLTD